MNTESDGPDDEGSSKPPPIFNIDGVINLVALAFALWVCITFIANPVRDLVADWLRGSQHDLPKDQTKLP